MSKQHHSSPKKDKQVCLHPLLFAIYPVLFLYGANFPFIEPADLIRPLCVMLVPTLLIWYAIKRYTKNVRKNEIILSLALLALFSYGSIYEAGRRTGFSFSPSRMTINETLLVAAIGGLLLGALYLFWAARDVSAWAYLMNMLGTALVAFTLVQGGKLTFYRSSTFELVPEGLEEPQPVREPAYQNGPPDIYYLILDGYGRQDVLREQYGCGNADFLEDLRRRDFFVADRSSSNYSRTQPAITAALNFGYLDTLVKTITDTLADRQPLREVLWRNRAARFLKKQGYSLVVTSTPFDNLNLARIADTYLTKWWFPSQVEVTLAGMTPLPTLARNLGWPVLYNAHRRRNLFAWEQLARSVERPGRKFVFTHVVSPHPPFVFGPHGEAIYPDRKYTWDDGIAYLGHPGASEQEYIEGYCGQVAFVNHKVRRVVDAILEGSAESPIIIIQGDHGPGVGLGAISLDSPGFRERFGILNALYLPGDAARVVAEDLTPVNTFRILFNYYFGTELELLENKNYFVSVSEPYNYLEVTADMSELIEPSTTDDPVGKAVSGRGAQKLSKPLRP